MRADLARPPSQRDWWVLPRRDVDRVVDEVIWTAIEEFSTDDRLDPLVV